MCPTTLERQLDQMENATMQAEIERLTGKSNAPKPKATKPKTSTKAQTPAQRKGFAPKTLGKALITKAKQVWTQYQRDPKAPKVTEREGSWRRGPMMAVSYVWGFTSNADGDAKVQAIQTAMGKPLTGPNGIMDHASDNPMKRQKCMGTTIAANYQAVPDRSGTYFLRPTSRKAREAVLAIADQGKRTGSQRGVAGRIANGKKVGKANTAAIKARKAQADTARQNGTVKVSVDKALRDSAKRAERNAQRAEARAKQKAQGKATEATPEATNA